MEAKLNIAKLNLSYTKISSPADGYVTRKNVEVGNQVQPGQPLMDFWTLVWPRVVLGIGMGFIFISLTTLTLSHIPRERMTDATSMYNLLRNIGGSVGVAFVTTILARRAQFHQARLVEHLTPFDMPYVIGKEKIADILASKGIPNLNPDTMQNRLLTSSKTGTKSIRRDRRLLSLRSKQSTHETKCLDWTRFG